MSQETRSVASQVIAAGSVEATEIAHGEVSPPDIRSAQQRSGFCPRTQNRWPVSARKTTVERDAIALTHLYCVSLSNSIGIQGTVSCVITVIKNSDEANANLTFGTRGVLRYERAGSRQLLPPSA